ncbi:uncharacterized protein LOC123883145 isoform X3 [Trifolium pratense]|uniref:uncharacterized protein LOC123883145 isoform X3 n=1 Tax=Trifolium pratense TaxID=57577 RepID=UPI001E6908E1|nr:uncharacterized protein LOC123883145 isoform X3 [Trifolium pratense]
MLLMSSSSIVCGSSSTKFMVPLSLPPSFNIKHRKKGLVFDYCGFNKNNKVLGRRHVVIKASSDVASPSFWENFKPPKSSSTHSFSDILWPSAGAFAAMAILGKLDQLLTPKGLSITVAPLGAVSAILFATPQAPSARVFLLLCGLKQVSISSIIKPANFAECTAVSMPLLFIDGVKLQHLSFWYVLYPGAAGCILLCFIQEVVLYMKKNFKF